MVGGYDPFLIPEILDQTNLVPTIDSASAVKPSVTSLLKADWKPA